MPEQSRYITQPAPRRWNHPGLNSGMVKTSLQNQKRGSLATSWVNDPTALPDAAYALLSGEQAYRLGRHNGYYQIQAAAYDSDEDYQRGYIQGWVDRKSAIASGLTPDIGWQDGDPPSESCINGRYDHCGPSGEIDASHR